MDTTAATTIGATVSVFVQLLKIAKPDLKSGAAIGAILLLAIGGVALWVWGQTATSVVDQSWAFGIFTAIANVALTAAGTYGLILGGINAAAVSLAAVNARLQPPADVASANIVPTPRRERKPRATPSPAPPPALNPNAAIPA